MHFLLLLVRLILDRLIPDWRDGLKMAARSDGRVEQMPMRPTLWSWWVSLLEEIVSRENRRPKPPRSAYGCARPPSSPSNPALRN